jgi:acetylornithine deacetylase/succinyl-diaminopimelate desuccinylase-like protein
MAYAPVCSVGVCVLHGAARSVADTNHLAAHGGALQGGQTRDAAAIAAGRPSLPTIIVGPTGGNTCAANEWVDVQSLLPCAQAILETTLTMLLDDDEEEQQEQQEEQGATGSAARSSGGSSKL